MPKLIQVKEAEQQCDQSDEVEYHDTARQARRSSLADAAPNRARQIQEAALRVTVTRIFALVVGGHDRPDLEVRRRDAEAMFKCHA
ncbi:hypothetical protein [Methylobacterium marchantiae]|uniref:Uncharacterized protein n=1 Tax=Methylobacterium marchantiae TaxID=600331 RepID=A0ABW3WZ99_9HYPH